MSATNYGEKSKIKILNTRKGSSVLEFTQTAAERLRVSMLRLISEHINESDGAINYKTLIDTKEFKDFRKIFEDLSYCDPSLLDDNERKAFFINVYNVLTMDALAEYHRTMEQNSNPTVNTVLDIPHFWEEFAYQIGPFHFTLDDIEHGILRGNRDHPSSKKTAFGESDPRSAMSLASLDPRIHFALNCGARSCPMVKAFSASSLDHRLEDITRSYIRQEVSIEEGPQGTVLLLPQILEWYSHDFSDTEEGVLRWLLNYVEDWTKEVIEALLEEQQGRKDITIRYFYDWTINRDKK